MKHCLTQFRSFRSPQTGSLKVGSIAPSIADLSADGNAVNAFPLWPEQSKARCLLISRSQAGLARRRHSEGTGRTDYVHDHSMEKITLRSKWIGDVMVMA